MITSRTDYAVVIEATGREIELTHSRDRAVEILKAKARSYGPLIVEEITTTVIRRRVYRPRKPMGQGVRSLVHEGVAA
jgi:hypothetical protein